MLIEKLTASNGMLVESLYNEGFEVICSVSYDDLISSIQQYRPDVLVIAMGSPDDLIFDRLTKVNEECPKPVVFFTEVAETKIIKRAVKAGVGAFIIDGISSRKIRPIIELSIERFLDALSLRHELRETKKCLNERKVIERAKGILMQQRNISEDQAYQSIRKVAMEQNKKLIDVAVNVIELSEIFGSLQSNC